MNYEWSEKLSIGNIEIDHQHQELLKYLNLLMVAVKQNNTEEEINRLFNFLKGYIAAHFSSEEKLMLKYKYPEFNSHKAEHENFSLMFNQFDLAKSEGASEILINKVQKFLHGWWVKHINQTDRSFGDFLKKQKDLG
ncbi:hypothetical protein BVY03_00505 [bacterium K02(2017)]|nr:hypothetical protein BVY03_00505 [bacterium K02(2017)]